MNGNRHHLTVVESTNMHTTAILSQTDMDEWSIVTADFQTGGKGQRGKRWDSRAGQNVLASIVIKPRILASDHYLLSCLSSLSLIETLSQYGIEAAIKWPNDILVANRKVAGMLIENVIKKEVIEYSIIGIGLNVNQTDFDAYPWPATSMKVEMGREISLDITEVLVVLTTEMKMLYKYLETDPDQLRHLVSEYLFRLGKPISYMLNGQEQQGILRGVDPSGELIVKHEDGERKLANGVITFMNSY